MAANHYDFLETSYRAELDILCVRWLREVDSSQLRFGYELGLQEALTHHARFWLFDIRRRDHADPQTAQWLTEEFLPSLASLFGGKVCIAYLLSPSHLDRIGNNPNDMSHVEAMRRTTCVEFFIEERGAVEWLSSEEVRR